MTWRLMSDVEGALFIVQIVGEVGVAEAGFLVSSDIDVKRLWIVGHDRNGWCRIPLKISKVMIVS